jgi:hypothetical protein
MVDNKKMVNGKMRTVHKGTKGGKYYISKGKKVYFGNTKRSTSTPSSSSNTRKRKRTRRLSPTNCDPPQPIQRGPGFIITLGDGIIDAANLVGQGANNVLHITSGALGRTLQHVPYARTFATAATMPPDGPRNQAGIGCDMMGEFREDCIRNYCIREPLSRFCKKTKQELKKITYGDLTHNQFMRELMAVSRRQLNNQRYRPIGNVGDVLVTAVQRAYRNKKFRNEQCQASRRFLAFYNNLPAHRQAEVMSYMSMNGSRYPQLLFGKNKVKRNTKKKTKQTRK